MITEDEINSLKSMEKKELFLTVADDVTSTNDSIGQIIRSHLWAEVFMDGIIFQTLKNPKKMLDKRFDEKQQHLFNSKLIDETHYKELKILNRIRNLYVHNIYPHEKALEEIKKLPSYDERKKLIETSKYPYDTEIKRILDAMKEFQFYDDIKNNPIFFEYQKSMIQDHSIFGLTSSLLTQYLMFIFWNPETIS